MNLLTLKRKILPHQKTPNIFFKKVPYVETYLKILSYLDGY